VLSPASARFIASGSHSNVISAKTSRSETDNIVVTEEVGVGIGRREMAELDGAVVGLGEVFEDARPAVRGEVRRSASLMKY
jgi:hypothetical protein